MGLYDSAIKYAMHILNNEPNYSLDRLRKISEEAYVIAKKYIDDIKLSKENVQKVIYTGLIRNINVAFINSQYEGWNLINNATKTQNVNMFLGGVHIIAESEEAYCNKLAPYIPGLTQLNLRINKLRLEIDTLEKTKPDPNLKGIEALKADIAKNNRIFKLIDEMSNLRKQRFDLIKEFMERNSIK